MEQELFNRQQKDWEQLVKEQSQALDKLIDNEIQIRKEYGFPDKLPPSQEQKILADRKAWLQEWDQKLADNARMPTENEMAEMHRQYLEDQENEHERRIQEHINDAAKPENRSRIMNGLDFLGHLSANAKKHDEAELPNQPTGEHEHNSEEADFRQQLQKVREHNISKLKPR